MSPLRTCGRGAQRTLSNICHLACQVDGHAKGADTWEAPAGKPMVTLTVRDGQRVDLTAEQIKKMTWPQHAKVWKVRTHRHRRRVGALFCAISPRLV